MSSVRAIPTTTTGDAVTSSRRWAGTGGFVVVALALLVIIAQAGAPSPLYPVYQAEWNLQPIVVTSIFAVYVVGLLVTLITVGSLSDHIGRRPVFLAAAVIAVVALIVFATATNVTELIIARALQGASVGAATGALGAALIDLQPAARPRLAAVLNGVIPPIALTVGAVSSGFLVQFAPDPTSTVFLVFGILILAAGVLVLFIAEKNERRPGAIRSLSPTVSIPREARRVFSAVVGCMISSWALGGLYLALGPTIVVSVLHLHSHVAGGLAVAALTGAGAITGLAIQKTDALKSMIVGAVALIVGPALTVVALEMGSTWGFFASSLIAGIGFGAAFQSALRLLLAVAPAEGRAGLLSTVYLVSYAAFGLPSIIAGLLVPSLGLITVVLWYAILVAVLAVIALVLQFVLRRTRSVEKAADRREFAL
ncbi:MFS transporter [Glaciihabitans sp. dw_435]|uniref:MFS transporter n=1 Tax=Glaciihabitans sp. dw_435 TaxID=2720081 RepID=UPI0027DDAFA4|nr:MFS transporter [Glaciihabitans sp. dw_435]